MMKMRALLFAAACLVAGPALAQQTPFSTYVTSLAPAGSVTGAERMFALQTGTSVTLTPYQILGKVIGDCTMASPPSIVCTKINGVTLAASATTDTTNASNISSGTLPLGRLALASASIYVGNVSNVPAAVILSGDCTITNAGAITCLKVNNVSLAAPGSATTDTTNAANISTGTLAGARQSAANLAASGNGGVTGVLPFANMPTGSLDQVLGYFGSTTLNAVGMPNCTTALLYSTTTHLVTCSAGGGTGNVSTSGSIVTNQIAQYASATTIKSTPLSGLATINVVKVQNFSSGGTYTPSTGLQYAIIECVGGGAGGGGAPSPGGTNITNGGGGGSGSYSKALASAATIGGSQVVLVGTAGAGAPGDGSTSGGTGAGTSVGSLCTASGASGGGAATTGNSGAGGAGGTAGTGNMVSQPGRPGQAGTFTSLSGMSLVTAEGGASFFAAGGGSQVNSTGISGLVGSGCGAGGSGGGSAQGNIAQSGGNGVGGCVTITEFTNQ